MSDNMHTGDIFDPSVHPGNQKGVEAPGPYGYTGHRYDPALDVAAAEARAPKKKKRVFMWAFIAVQVLFILWLVGGVGGADSAAQCAGKTSEYFTQADCEAASQVGTGIGAAIVLLLWAVVDFIMAVTYLIVRLARR